MYKTPRGPVLNERDWNTPCYPSPLLLMLNWAREVRVRGRGGGLRNRKGRLSSKAGACEARHWKISSRGGGGGRGCTSVLKGEE
jgi:hypothetical protein